MGPEPAYITHISETSNYRYLQRMAKSMKLPSNVKKKYLVEMILAKQHSSPEALDAIVARIKAERKRLSKPRKSNIRRKKWIQGKEISSTSIHSPPICTTPELPYDPYTINTTQTILRCKTSILNPLMSKQGRNTDRVLRSSYKRTRFNMNYSILDINSAEVYEAQNTLDSSVEVQENYERTVQMHKYSLARNIARRHPIRERRLSGISPLKCSEQTDYQRTPTHNYSARREDNPITKLNFLPQVPQRSTHTLTKNKMTQTKNLLSNMKPLILSLKRALQNPTTTVQDIVNSGIDGSFSNSSTETARSSSEDIEIEPVTKKQRFVVNVGKPGSQIRSYGRNVAKKYPIANTYFERDSDVGTSEGTYVIENRKHNYRKDILQNPSETFLEYSFIEGNNVTDNQGGNTTDYRNESYTGVFAESKENDDLVQSQRAGSIVNTNQNTLANTLPGSVEVKYPNMSALTDVYPDDQQEYVSVVAKQETDTMSAYYHKKIWANNNRSQSALSTYPERGQSEGSLPHISDVFSLFDNPRHKHLTQPLYVDVGHDAERVGDPGSTYLKAASIDAIAVVHATPTPAPLYTDLLAVDDQGYNLQACTTQRLQDYGCMDETERLDMHCNEVLQQSPVESVASTLSEEMADAYEVISQDGDYMERIGMDVRTACVVCDWIGPRSILEHHIRMEHASLIVMRNDTKWSYSVSFSEVLEGVYVLSEYQSRVYVLCVMSLCTDSCRATLSVLPKFNDADLDQQPYRQCGRITVYHKVTGEPYTWQGPISYPIPYIKEESTEETGSNWLDLNLTSLNLLPNSANLMLVNGELVTNSSTKVIAGQPELDSIKIEFHVEILDLFY